MEKLLHRAAGRGVGEYGWLSTRYSFSFADWYEPARMGFGALRVLNDDTIAPGAGFPMHAHRDMEIITVVTRGVLAHTDSLGNTGTIPAGDVQVMSAGTGIRHAEYNASQTEPLSLFQIWIEPREPGGVPRYAQESFGREAPAGEFVTLVAPARAGGPLVIGQEAYLSRLVLDAQHSAAYELRNPAHGVYIFLIEGTMAVEGVALGARDALGIWDVERAACTTPAQASALFLEVPMAARGGFR